MVKFNKASGKGTVLSHASQLTLIHSQKAASIKQCNIRTQEMGLGMRADCFLKTSAQFIVAIEINNETHQASLKDVENKCKTQPTQSHGPMTRPGKKRSFLQGSQETLCFLTSQDNYNNARNSYERTPKISKIQPLLSQLP